MILFECRYEGCAKATTGRKPYCIEHIEALEYVKRLLEEIKARSAEEEKARIEDWRAINIQGTRSREIVEALRAKGIVSIKRLALDVDLPVEILDIYLRALRRARCVRMRQVKGHRGTQTLVSRRCG